MPRFLPLLLLCSAITAHGQTVSNISCTDASVLAVLKGQYDPSAFAASNVIDDHGTILCELRTRISPDSLKAHLEHLVSFHSRNTYSDTVSDITGIGAARRWAYSRFQQFSAENEGRLLPAYLQFDYQTTEDCGDVNGLRNVMAVLPGSDTTNKSVVIIEAHLDSRCADNCDPQCYAPGAEDNGSGSALVIELARVLSRYTFHHTLVFLLTVGEEQGLVGAEAMATFCTDQGIAIKGVQNNDIVGGIICGNTSSAPSCPGHGDIDSLEVRLFSHGAASAPHRGFARSIKMFYQEKLQDQVPVPMTISIIGQEDRTGRGGDHIPFRMHGFRDVRFTAANEDGDASVDSSWYNDRQHTSGDVFGIDTDADQELDSFFVDVNYLQRNTVINGLSAVLLALGPETPMFVVHDEPTGLRVSFASGFNRLAYRVGVRNSSSSLDFDAVYRTTDTSFVVPGLEASHFYYISVAAIDSATIMSPFSAEVARSNDLETPAAPTDQLPYGLACTPIGIREPLRPATMALTCQPDPFAGHTTFQITSRTSGNASLVIRDLTGRILTELPVVLHEGMNTIEYDHHAPAGVYGCTLMMKGVALTSGRFVAL